MTTLKKWNSFDFPIAPVLKYLTGHKGHIAGGVFKNIFQKERFKDVDIFFQSESDWKEAVAYYKGNEEYELEVEAKNFISFKEISTGVRVELIGYSTTEKPETSLFGDDDSLDSISDVIEIHRGDDELELYGTPEETLSSFDFTVTKFAVYRTSDDEFEVLYHEKFFEHLHLKRLIIDDSLVRPFSTFERTLRYTGYGYKMCRESKAALIQAILNEGELGSIEQISASLYDGMD